MRKYESGAIKDAGLSFGTCGPFRSRMQRVRLIHGVATGDEAGRELRGRPLSVTQKYLVLLEGSTLAAV